MSVTLHGHKRLVSSEPRNVVDALLDLWLSTSAAAEPGAAPADAAGKVDAIAEVRYD